MDTSSENNNSSSTPKVLQCFISLSLFFLILSVFLASKSLLNGNDDRRRPVVFLILKGMLSKLTTQSSVRSRVLFNFFVQVVSLSIPSLQMSSFISSIERLLVFPLIG